MPKKKPLKPKEKKLTLKQQRFIDKYIETGNATKAALHAYDTTTRHTAQSIGTENLSLPVIQESIAEKIAEGDDAITVNLARKQLKKLIVSENEASINNGLTHYFKITNAYPKDKADTDLAKQKANEFKTEEELDAEYKDINSRIAEVEGGEKREQKGKASLS